MACLGTNGRLISAMEPKQVRNTVPTVWGIMAMCCMWNEWSATALSSAEVLPLVN